MAVVVEQGAAGEGGGRHAALAQQCRVRIVGQQARELVAEDGQAARLQHHHRRSAQALEVWAQQAQRPLQEAPGQPHRAEVVQGPAAADGARRALHGEAGALEHAPIDEAARLAADAERLSLSARHVLDLLGEADPLAAEPGREVVGLEDLERARAAREHRAGGSTSASARRPCAGRSASRRTASKAC